MQTKDSFFVTHIIVPEIPDKGYDQVFFYTATAQSYEQRKYFWGTDNNSFDEKFINNLMQQRKVFRLEIAEYPMLLKNNETIWVDNEGELYVADLNDPTQFQRKLPRQSWIDIKMARIKYEQIIALVNLPRINNKISLNV